MKKILLSLFMIASLYAAPVPNEDIVLISNNILEQRFPTDIQYSIRDITTVTELGNELIYIVPHTNFKKSFSFKIVVFKIFFWKFY